MKKAFTFFGALAMAMVCVLLAFVLVTVATGGKVDAQNYNRGVFGPLYAKQLHVSGLATYSGGMSGSDINTKELPVDASFAWTPYGSSLVIASGGTINPYRSIVVLDAAGAVSTSASTAIADGWNDGQLCTIVNGSANAITVKNSANTLIGADLALGQYDSLTVWWDGSNWIRMSSANN